MKNSTDVIAPERHWSWAEGQGPHALKIGNVIYIGGQISLTDAGGVRNAKDIENQTANVFSDMVTLLQEGGGSMDDLVKLHTYYVYEGDGTAVTSYWERMTQVRLKYLANPGPAATAVRVSGVPATDLLIGIDGIAFVGGDKRRIMPKFTWDWSIPTPFSQGWRVDNKVYVGGQISADMQGKAIAIGDVESQTKHVLELIRHVLIDGGASWANLATLRICYKHSGSAEQSAKLFQQILEIIREVVPEPRPAITAFGADLLYEGLLLEIDGVAIIESDRKSIASGGIQASPKGFPEAWRTGSELYFGALGVSDGSSLSAQATACIDKLASLLSAANATPRDLVKLTFFFVATAEDPAGAEGQKAIRKILRERLPTPGPVITLVQVASLPEQERLIQVDGVCICDRA